MPDIFTETNAPANYYEELVGDGKKFKTPEDLAKVKWESDNFIEDFKQRLARAEAELEQRETVENILKQNLKPNQQTPDPGVSNQPPITPENKPLTKEELVQLMREVTQEEDATRTKSQNISYSAETLAKIVGSDVKAQELVHSKARELGVSVAFLQDVAAQSPKAFFAQLGINPEAKTTQSRPTQGDINPAARLSNEPQADTYQWFQKIRKDNPTLYRTPAFQMRMHQIALEKGDAFFE